MPAKRGITICRKWVGLGLIYVKKTRVFCDFLWFFRKKRTLFVISLTILGEVRRKHANPKSQDLNPKQIPITKKKKIQNLAKGVSLDNLKRGQTSWRVNK